MFHRRVLCQFHRFPPIPYRVPARRTVGAQSFYVKTPLDQTSSQRCAASLVRTNHSFSDGPVRTFSSPSFTKPHRRSVRKFVPRKAAVELTEKARDFFRTLLENSPGKDGIILNYQQASSGQPRMVFSFEFVTKDQLSPQDEGVSLEILEDGKPKSPVESMDDGLPKLYVHHNAFLKVLGARLDLDTEHFTPILYDREGNLMDPNA